MCNASSTKAPEEKLSDLIRREAGVEFNPQALRMLIRSHWKIVSGYAHAIHDAGSGWDSVKSTPKDRP